MALALFKLDQPFLLDQLVRAATGGRHVHCEIALPAPSGELVAFSALYPDGVLRASPLRDPFYRPPQRWTALDLADVLHTPQAAFAFLQRRIGQPYNTAAYLTYLLPLPLARLLPPRGYTCSQLLAETLLRFGTLHPAAKRHLQHAAAACGRPALDHAAQAKLAPQDLFEALLLEPRARHAPLPALTPRAPPAAAPPTGPPTGPQATEPPAPPKAAQALPTKPLQQALQQALHEPLHEALREPRQAPPARAADRTLH